MHETRSSIPTPKGREVGYMRNTGLAETNLHGCRLGSCEGSPRSCCPPSAPDPACIQAFLRKGLAWQTAFHSCLLLSALRLLGEVRCRVPQPSIPVSACQPQLSDPVPQLLWELPSPPRLSTPSAGGEDRDEEQSALWPSQRAQGSGGAITSSETTDLLPPPKTDTVITDQH